MNEVTKFEEKNIGAFQALAFVQQQRKELDAQEKHIKDTLLKSSRIGGGYVLWQEDITDVTALLERLEENRKNIEDSNCLEV